MAEREGFERMVWIAVELSALLSQQFYARQKETPRVPIETSAHLGITKVTSRFLGFPVFGIEEKGCRGSMVTRG